ncbi:MAG: hypothetical protein ACYCV7_14755 [Acidimicrobiales bacterium]
MTTHQPQDETNRAAPMGMLMAVAVIVIVMAPLVLVVASTARTDVVVRVGHALALPGRRRRLPLLATRPQW